MARGETTTPLSPAGESEYSNPIWKTSAEPSSQKPNSEDTGTLTRGDDAECAYQHERVQRGWFGGRLTEEQVTRRAEGSRRRMERREERIEQRAERIEVKAERRESKLEQRQERRESKLELWQEREERRVDKKEVREEVWRRSRVELKSEAEGQARKAYADTLAQLLSVFVVEHGGREPGTGVGVGRGEVEALEAQARGAAARGVHARRAARVGARASRVEATIEGRQRRREERRTRRHQKVEQQLLLQLQKQLRQKLRQKQRHEQQQQQQQQQRQQRRLAVSQLKSPSHEEEEGSERGSQELRQEEGKEGTAEGEKEGFFRIEEMGELTGVDEITEVVAVVVAVDVGGGGVERGYRSALSDVDEERSGDDLSGDDSEDEEDDDFDFDFENDSTDGESGKEVESRAMRGADGGVGEEGRSFQDDGKQGSFDNRSGRGLSNSPQRDLCFSPRYRPRRRTSTGGKGACQGAGGSDADPPNRGTASAENKTLPRGGRRAAGTRHVDIDFDSGASVEANNVDSSSSSSSSSDAGGCVPTSALLTTGGVDSSSSSSSLAPTPARARTALAPPTEKVEPASAADDEDQEPSPSSSSSTSSASSAASSVVAGAEAVAVAVAADAGVLQQFRLRLRELSPTLAEDSAQSGFALDDACLRRYLLMSNGVLTQPTAVATTAATAATAANTGGAAATNTTTADTATSSSSSSSSSSPLLSALSLLPRPPPTLTSPPRRGGGSGCCGGGCQGLGEEAVVEGGGCEGGRESGKLRIPPNRKRLLRRGVKQSETNASIDSSSGGDVESGGEEGSSIDSSFSGTFSSRNSSSRRRRNSSSSSSSSSKKCAAALLLDTVTWRVEASVGQQPKALLLDAARTGQLHVSGFDTQGRPVVVYSPTSEADCPVWLAVLWLVYNLERAIALGEAGAGPQGKVSPQYTFVITFARTGVPPMKTVRACLEVFGKHYPGRSGPILLCHGGTVSAWVARWLKPLAPPHQRDKLKLVSAKEDRSGFMATLVEPGQLEPRFGGGTSTFSFDPEVYLADYKPVDPADYLATNLAYLNQDDGRSIVGIKI